MGLESLLPKKIKELFYTKKESIDKAIIQYCPFEEKNKLMINTLKKVKNSGYLYRCAGECKQTYVKRRDALTLGTMKELK